MDRERVIELARQANVPDLSCNPEGELMPWVVDFAHLVRAEALREAAENVDSCGYISVENLRRMADEVSK